MFAKAHRFLGVAGAAVIAAASGAAAAKTVTIHIENLAFAPVETMAEPGDTIEWISTDFLDHTATARNKDWDVAIPAHGTGRTTVSHTGVIDYYCRFHPNMTGRIVVTGKTQARPKP
jgi:plastocyanin